ncbi:MAG: GTP cyclohydrolase I FolE [Thermanaerothrix sp.]|uniref:GTP cyclohydrolase 1 n=1 Tax=Thermanaerothrix solaris TaxID=3058434 RepID=A0ABU3NIW6_9CHLR|nr:GTP cyclohydrolase I FolE [Thermanaerothrix sp. 4228-RoL]MDT8896798.1 GTP cyclohydrolase I FolE [Thermanaerothrix sp. 4228-RoL]
MNANVYAAADLLDGDGIDTQSIQESVRRMLIAFGEDPNRQGLLRTPERVAKMYEELLAGYRIDPVELINDAIFDVNYDEMVVVRDIEFYSLCEHHMLPFIGRAHVAYIPKGKVIGLSKIPRVVDMFARRLQVQERMTRQIADFLNEVLHPMGVAVVVEAIHMCAMIRGVKKHNSRMTTSTMLGAFRTSMATRMEFLDNISRSAEPLHI